MEHGFPDQLTYGTTCCVEDDALCLKMKRSRFKLLVFGGIRRSPSPSYCSAPKNPMRTGVRFRSGWRELNGFVIPKFVQKQPMPFAKSDQPQCLSFSKNCRSKIQRGKSLFSKAIIATSSHIGGSAQPHGRMSKP